MQQPPPLAYPAYGQGHVVEPMLTHPIMDTEGQGEGAFLTLTINGMDIKDMVKVKTPMKKLGKSN